MKIRKLHLKNIGVFDDEEINFQECPAKDKAEIHILTGENGTGKTTILLALANLFAFKRKHLSENRSSGLRGLYQNELMVEKNSFHKRIKPDCEINFDVKYENEVKNLTFNYSESEQNLIGNISNLHGAFDGTLEVFSFLQEVKGAFENTMYWGAFAYSGYRRIRDEQIEIGKEIDENPLYQALDFIKDENSKFNVNQWLGQNLINRSLAQTRNKLDEANKLKDKISEFESIINKIIVDETNNNEIRFEMQSATKLVLIKNEQELDFDVLPDGLKSLISWIGDLLMRLDSLKWKDDTPIFDREIILFLDEIEVHLHPAWQRKVLPVVQKLFKNAQIFVSTHSPFVVNSVDDAWVYKLKVENGKAKVASVKKTENSQSITQVLREVFDIYGLFGKEVQDKIDRFEELRDKILANGTNTKDEKELLKIAKSLYDEPSDQVKNIVKGELQQLSEIKGKEYSI